MKSIQQIAIILLISLFLYTQSLAGSRDITITHTAIFSALFSFGYASTQEDNDLL